MKNTQSKIKPIKTEKEPGKTYCLGCKDFTHNFRSQVVKMTNKVLRKKSNCVVCRSNKSRFLKQKTIQRFKNCCHKIMKTHSVKCRKDTENIDTKMVRTKKRQIIYGVKMY